MYLNKVNYYGVILPKMLNVTVKNQATLRVRSAYYITVESWFLNFKFNLTCTLNVH